MRALLYTPRPSPQPEELQHWSTQDRRDYYAIPSGPNRARFPDLEQEEWEYTCFHSSDEGEFADDEDGNGHKLGPDEHEMKRREACRLVSDVNALETMYKSMRSIGYMLRPRIMEVHKQAICCDRAVSQEMAMRDRGKMYPSYWNPFMRERWTTRQVWTGFPIRMKRKDGIWRELASDEDRGSEDSLSDG